MKDPDGTYFQYDYDGDDRLSDVRENGGTIIVSESYYPIGLPSGEVRGGVTSSYDYDPAERPQTWTDTFINPSADLTTTLFYNPANQITTRTLSNDSYDYPGYVHGTTNYTPNGLNQYASVAGNSFTYDSNGNLKTDPTTQTSYSYDVENRLTNVSGNSHTATLTYDPLGRLFQIVTPGGTTQFLYDGDQLVGEYSGAGTLVQRYVDGPGSDEPLIWYSGASVSSSTRQSLQTNYQGSVDSVADATGKETSIDTYDEYGRPATGNMGRFQYTGQAWMPELGLYYYKARMYDPRLGRFLQTDPIGYTDDLDLYAYVGNDPLDKTDPSGLKGCEWGGKTFTSCTITIVYDKKTSKGTLTVTGVNKGEKDPTTLLTSQVVVGGEGHLTPTGRFTATYWQHDHTSKLYGRWADTPYSKTHLGLNAFGPYQLHIKELEKRGIYIHGTMGPSWMRTTLLNDLVSPSSHGCIRMCNADDITLHAMMPNPRGNEIDISAAPEE